VIVRANRVTQNPVLTGVDMSCNTITRNVATFIIVCLMLLAAGEKSIVHGQTLSRWIPATAFGDSVVFGSIWRHRDGSYLIRHGSGPVVETRGDVEGIYDDHTLSNVVFDADSFKRKVVYRYSTRSLPYERGDITSPPIEYNGVIFHGHHKNLLRINENGVSRIPVCLDSISRIDGVLPLADGTTILSSYERLEKQRGDTFALPTVIATREGDTCTYVRRLFNPGNGYLSHMNVTAEGVVFGVSQGRRNKNWPLLSTIDGKGIVIHGIERPDLYRVHSIVPSPSGGWFLQLGSLLPETRFTSPFLALETDSEFNVIHKQVYEPNNGGTRYRDQGDAYMAISFGSVQFMWRSGRQSVTINADVFKDIVPSRLPITPVDGIVQGDSLIVVCQTGIAIFTLPPTSVNDSQKLLNRPSRPAIVRGTHFQVAKTHERANTQLLLFDALGRTVVPLYREGGSVWLIETAHLASGLWHVRTSTQTIPFLVVD